MERESGEKGLATACLKSLRAEVCMTQNTSFVIHGRSNTTLLIDAGTRL